MYIAEAVSLAKREVDRAKHNLSQAYGRNAPRADIINLMRKLQYRQFVLDVLKSKEQE